MSSRYPDANTGRNSPASVQFPGPGNTRVPFAAFSDPDLYRRELARIFHGPSWHFLGLDDEIPNPGDYKTTYIGETPVIVARVDAARINGFVNRCSHRGNLVCIKERGTATKLTCVYHAWSFDLEGNLTGVAFQRGARGEGGMPDRFRREEHGLRKLRIGTVCGLIFGSLSDEAPELGDYIGPEIGARIRRVLHGRPKVLGSVTQALHNNWKLYAENVRDTYHASLLHLFYGTFGMTRLSAEGGIVIGETGGHHASYSRGSASTAEGNKDYDGLRSNQSGFQLEDARLLRHVDEFGDGITVQILSLFPNFVLHQINNSIAAGIVVPKGPDAAELVWLYLGLEDDDPAMTERRLLQANLSGPAGYISMEDGAVTGFIQRAIKGSEAACAVLDMGGDGHGSTTSRATEASVRGFWHAYRAQMGL